jgi:hypothetical protein
MSHGLTVMAPSGFLSRLTKCAESQDLRLQIREHHVNRAVDEREQEFRVSREAAQGCDYQLGALVALAVVESLAQFWPVAALAALRTRNALTFSF